MSPYLSDLWTAGLPDQPVDRSSEGSLLPDLIMISFERQTEREQAARRDLSGYKAEKCNDGMRGSDLRPDHKYYGVKI